MTCRTCHHDELKIRHHLAWIFIILIISMRNGQNSNHGIAELLMSPSYTHVLGPFLLWFDLRATIVNRAIIVWRVLWVDLVYWTKKLLLFSDALSCKYSSLGRFEHWHLEWEWFYIFWWKFNILNFHPSLFYPGSSKTTSQEDSKIEFHFRGWLIVISSFLVDG